jgi:DNA-binding response OmpR family regulator
MHPRVLIVEDSKPTRRDLSAIVSSRWTVCGQAKSERSAVKKFRELKPDLVLLGLAMPDIDSIEVARQMHAIDHSVPLIFVTPVRLSGTQSIEQIVSEFESSGRQPKSRSKAGTREARAETH